MKKLLVLFFSAAVLTALLTVISAADTIPADTASSTPATQPAAVQSAPAASTGDTKVVIAPDSLLYPIKNMIESVQVALTFTAEGKAELLISFANERLNEANLMTDKNKQQLVQKVMEAYVRTINEAAAKTAEAAKGQKDVKPLLDSIQITEENAGKIVIKATGVVSADVAEQLKTAVADKVKTTIAGQAAAEAKDQFKAANDQVKQARENLKLVNKAGSEAMVKTANDELLKAQQARDKALELKKQAEAYKGQINESLKQDDEDDNEINEHDKDDDHDSDKAKVNSEHKNIKVKHVKKIEHGDKNNNQDENDNEEHDD